jgi:hypothetical protein
MSKKCFVVMGFGAKTDYRTQRLLDLDKTYRIICDAVQACDVECIRADDIVHAGVIDKPMYEMLLNADLVIADLSTSNENAIYELGVRHALRPNTTIVIAESQFKFPFDVNHVVIRTYEHLGKGIDFEEAERLKGTLIPMIRQMLAGQQAVDSPVFTFLPALRSQHSGAAPEPATVAVQPAAGAAVADLTFTALLDAFRSARAKEDWVTADALIHKLRELKADDPFLVQQHAFVTYQGKTPRLEDAKQVLAELRPRESCDPETLGIWGAIHKRLWDAKGQRSDLDEAVLSYERGFYLRRDYYTGINHAFLLNVRAKLQDNADEATADRVLARRVRRQVLDILTESAQKLARKADGSFADPHEAYWQGATRLEALLGLGEHAQLDVAKAELYRTAPEPWMKTTTDKQLQKLRDLL